MAPSQATSGFDAVEAKLESQDAQIAALNKEDEDMPSTARTVSAATEDAEDASMQFDSIDAKLKEEDDRISAMDHEDDGAAGSFVQRKRPRRRMTIDLIQADQDDEDVSEDDLEASMPSENTPKLHHADAMVQTKALGAAKDVRPHLRRSRGAAAEQARAAALALEASIDADARTAEERLSQLRGSVDS